MNVEIEEESRDFVTIYKKDYLVKKKRPTDYKRSPQYSQSLNILNESYNQYVNAQLNYQLFFEDERSKDTIKCMRACDKFPRLRNIILDEKIIEREKKKSIQTVYRLSYSRDSDEYFRSRLDDARKDVMLPQDWIIPETVQRCAYRNPWAIATRDLIKPQKIFKPCNNLEPSSKEREILRITTGNSEYASTIGATGDVIVLRNHADVKEHIGDYENH